MPLGFIDTGTLVRHSKNIMAAQISCCFCAVVVAVVFIFLYQQAYHSREIALEKLGKIYGNYI